MTQAQASFLMSLPVVNHIPHLHLFVAHAGLLPSDPRLSPTDPRQPLTHLPDTDHHHHPIGYDPDKDTEAFVPRGHVKMLATRGSDTRSNLKLNARAENVTEGTLREMQETALLQEIPQNRDAWVVLNMRSVKKKGKVTRCVDTHMCASDASLGSC